MSLDGGVSRGVKGDELLDGESRDRDSQEDPAERVDDPSSDNGDSAKHFLPGEGKTLRGALIAERREAYLAVMELCPAAILIPLQDCPQIAAGTCLAVAKVMRELDEEVVTPFSDTPCPDAEKRQADYAALMMRNNPSIPWVFDSFDKSQR